MHIWGSVSLTLIFSKTLNTVVCIDVWSIDSYIALINSKVLILVPTSCWFSRIIKILGNKTDLKFW